MRRDHYEGKMLPARANPWFSPPAWQYVAMNPPYEEYDEHDEYDEYDDNPCGGRHNPFGAWDDPYEGLRYNPYDEDEEDEEDEYDDNPFGAWDDPYEGLRYNPYDEDEDEDVYEDLRFNPESFGAWDDPYEGLRYNPPRRRGLLGRAARGAGRDVRGAGRAFGRDVRGVGRALGRDVRGVGRAFGRGVRGAGSAFGRGARRTEQFLENPFGAWDDPYEGLQYNPEVACYACGMIDCPCGCMGDPRRCRCPGSPNPGRWVPGGSHRHKGRLYRGGGRYEDFHPGGGFRHRGRWHSGGGHWANNPETFGAWDDPYEGLHYNPESYGNPWEDVENYHQSRVCPHCSEYVGVGDRGWRDPSTGELFCCKACAKEHKAEQFLKRSPVLGMEPAGVAIRGTPQGGRRRRPRRLMRTAVEAGLEEYPEYDDDDYDANPPKIFSWTAPEPGWGRKAYARGSIPKKVETAPHTSSVLKGMKKYYTAKVKEMRAEGLPWGDVAKRMKYGDKKFSPPKAKSVKAWGEQKARSVFYAKLRNVWIRHDIADMLPEATPAKKPRPKPKKMPAKKKAVAKKRKRRAG